MDKIILEGSATDKVRKICEQARKSRELALLLFLHFLYGIPFLNFYKNICPSEQGSSRREIGKYRQCILPSKCLKHLELLLCNSED